MRGAGCKQLSSADYKSSARQSQVREEGEDADAADLAPPEKKKEALFQVARPHEETEQVPPSLQKSNWREPANGSNSGNKFGR